MPRTEIKDLLLIVVLAVLIAIFVWRVFGKSPSLDQVSMGLSLLFLVLAFESRSDSKALKRQNMAVIDKLEDISKELAKINKKL